jgi:uncharacterized protein YndB with AHSA1/START domain
MVVTRTFDVRAERLWRAWSDPDEVMRWWGPLGFTSPVCLMDFHEGCVTLLCMRSEEGWELFNTWTYRSIVPMERIEYVHGFADRDWNPVAPAQLGLASGIPDEVLNIVTFTAIDDVTTELTVHEYGYENQEIVEVSRAGVEQFLDKMVTSVATPLIPVAWVGT